MTQDAGRMRFADGFQDETIEETISSDQSG